MTLVLAASYSYDCLIISTMLVFFSSIMKYITGEKLINTKTILLASLIFIIVIPIKMVYFPIILLLFCIDGKKFARPWYKYVWIVVVSITTILVILSIHSDSIRYYFTKEYSPVSSETSISISDDTSLNADSGYDEDHIWTVNDAKGDPLEFIGVLFRTLFSTPNQTFMNISGYYFGWFSYEIPISLACIFPILFGVSLITDKCISLSTLEKSMFIIIIISSGFLTMLVMLLAETPYGYPTIIGAQGRYFIPLVPLLGVLLKPQHISVRDGLSLKLICFSVLSNTLVSLYLLNAVLA